MLCIHVACFEEASVNPIVVTVFGSSRPAPLEPAYQAAFELGRGIADAGWTVCNGGYGGTMEASAKGAVEAGGHTIGVTCRIFGGRIQPNQYIKQEVPTFDLHARLTTLTRLAKAYVVLPGGTGTLLELALVWELVNKGLLRPKRPVILLGNHWQPLIAPILQEQPKSLVPQIIPDVPRVLAALHEALDAPPV
jgi:uncharacterized protein (TIGR00730 family)